MAISNISDRWLWLGVGVFFLLAAKGIRYAITDTTWLIQLPAEDVRSEEKGEDEPENKLSLRTLRTLASSPNPNIRSAAGSLIITRFARTTHAAETITDDLQSEDPEIRRKARHVVQYLQEWDKDFTALSSRSPFHAGNESPTSLETDPEFLRWQRSFEEELNNRERRGGSTSMLSPLARLEALTSLETLNGMNGAREEAGSATFAGWDRIPVEQTVTVGQDEAERRRGRREVAVIHEGPGRVNEGDIFRPR